MRVVRVRFDACGRSSGFVLYDPSAKLDGFLQNLTGFWSITRPFDKLAGFGGLYDPPRFWTIFVFYAGTFREIGRFRFFCATLLEIGRFRFFGATLREIGRLQFPAKLLDHVHDVMKATTCYGFCDRVTRCVATCPSWSRLSTSAFRFSRRGLLPPAAPPPPPAGAAA